MSNKKQTIDKTYQANELLYIRCRADIEVQESGKCKIGGNRPAFSKILKQPMYNCTSGPYYSLLTGREYQKDRFLILIDVDAKEEGETRNGLELMELLNFDQYGAPKQATPSKGFHYLFYADPEQKQNLPAARTTLQYQGKTYNVDMKFTNQLCNCEPSVIVSPETGKEYVRYKWLNPEKLADIPRLPDAIFELVRKAPSSKSSKQIP